MSSEIQKLVTSVPLSETKTGSGIQTVICVGRFPLLLGDELRFLRKVEGELFEQDWRDGDLTEKETLEVSDGLIRKYGKGSLLIMKVEQRTKVVSLLLGDIKDQELKVYYKKEDPNGIDLDSLAPPDGDLDDIEPYGSNPLDEFITFEEQ